MLRAVPSRMKHFLSRSRRPLLVAAFCFVLAACTSTSRVWRTYEGTTEIDTREDYIMRSGGGCWGTCARYDVVIFESGRVVYFGDEDVGTIGRREGHISKAQFVELRMKVELHRTLFTREPPMDGCTSDTRHVRLRVFMGGKVRERLIDLRCHYYEQLWPILEEIDKVAWAEQWIKPRPPIF
jgi:hypothetical protein